jgi:hypothetical protein
MAKILRIIRDTYEIVSTDDGLSDRTDGCADVADHELIREAGDGWAETPVRQAVNLLRREGLGFDGSADWFTWPEPYSHPYTAECEDMSGHLEGDWTDSERAAIVRMLSAAARFDAARARAAYRV